MAEYILALHSGHNAAALIGDHRGILHAVQEERLRREKNYWGFPEMALRACLEAVGAEPSDVRVIVYGGQQVVTRYHSRDEVLRAYSRQESLIGKLRQRVAMPLVLRMQPRFGQQRLHQLLDEAGFKGIPVVHYDHHRAHAASAYYGLRKDPETPHLILTCDGDGDNISASVRVIVSGEETVISSTHWSSSLGAIYSWVTYLMGFVPLEHEYKLMGMAPYASESAAEETAAIFSRYLGLDDSGLRFRNRTSRRTNDLHDKLLRDLQGVRFDHICGGLQRFTEDLLADWAAAAVAATGTKRVLAAGGVFMNVKANKRIAELDDVESFAAFPSCGDETLPFGAFYLAAAEQFGQENVAGLDHLYYGDDIDDRDVADALAGSGLSHSFHDDPAEPVAEILAAGQPVARCCGRMEYGARALGNRSILADPGEQDAVRVINRMIKKRDFWMPFAPMIQSERQDEYIRNEKELQSPFMMMTFDTRENFREMIAAVHNADLTCRAQILSETENREMHSLLSAFASRTGRGVLLNTSFNLHGFPIVRTPQDALDVFVRSGLTHMQLGNYIVRKSQG